MARGRRRPALRFAWLVLATLPFAGVAPVRAQTPSPTAPADAGEPALAKEARVPEPDGYRMDNYKAPVPVSLAGATVVDVEEAHALWQSATAAFIDVLPRAPKPVNLPEGTLWHEKPRISIPRAIWLPNTGYGDIAEETLTYFRDGLEKATGGDPTKPLVFFCLADCWMSWNAGKRALENGYSKVYWMPDGSDGWAAVGYETAVLEPEL